MLHDLSALLAPPLIERLVLMANHLLSREPQAMARLQPHRGRVLRLDVRQLRLLPALPALDVVITPAGLLEWCRDALPADLTIRLNAANPAALALQAVGGQQLPLVIEGDAQLAADVDWLSKNLRWDVADDLERLFGPLAAHQLHRVGSALARTLQSAARLAGGAAGRMRPR